MCCIVFKVFLFHCDLIKVGTYQICNLKNFIPSMFQIKTLVLIYLLKFFNFFAIIKYLQIYEGVFTYNSSSKYACTSVTSTQFVVCVVVESNLQSLPVLGEQLVPDHFNFLYHR